MAQMDALHPSTPPPQTPSAEELPSVWVLVRTQ